MHYSSFVLAFVAIQDWVSHGIAVSGSVPASTREAAASAASLPLSPNGSVPKKGRGAAEHWLSVHRSPVNSGILPRGAATTCSVSIAGPASTSSFWMPAIRPFEIFARQDDGEDAAATPAVAVETVTMPVPEQTGQASDGEQVEPSSTSDEGVVATDSAPASASATTDRSGHMVIDPSLKWAFVPIPDPRTDNSSSNINSTVVPTDDTGKKLAKILPASLLPPAAVFLAGRWATLRWLNIRTGMTAAKAAADSSSSSSVWNAVTHALFDSSEMAGVNAQSADHAALIAKTLEWKIRDEAERYAVFQGGPIPHLSDETLEEIVLDSDEAVAKSVTDNAWRTELETALRGAKSSTTLGNGDLLPGAADAVQGLRKPQVAKAPDLETIPEENADGTGPEWAPEPRPVPDPVTDSESELSDFEPMPQKYNPEWDADSDASGSGDESPSDAKSQDSKSDDGKSDDGKSQDNKSDDGKSDNVKSVDDSDAASEKSAPKDDSSSSSPSEHESPGEPSDSGSTGDGSWKTDDSGKDTGSESGNDAISEKSSLKDSSASPSEHESSGPSSEHETSGPPSEHESSGEPSDGSWQTDSSGIESGSEHSKDATSEKSSPKDSSSQHGSADESAGEPASDSGSAGDGSWQTDSGESGSGGYGSSAPASPPVAPAVAPPVVAPVPIPPPVVPVVVPIPPPVVPIPIPAPGLPIPLHIPHPHIPHPSLGDALGALNPFGGDGSHDDHDDDHDKKQHGHHKDHHDDDKKHHKDHDEDKKHHQDDDDGRKKHDDEDKKKQAEKVAEKQNDEQEKQQKHEDKEKKEQEKETKKKLEGEKEKKHDEEKEKKHEEEKKMKKAQEKEQEKQEKQKERILKQKAEADEKKKEKEESKSKKKHHSSTTSTSSSQTDKHHKLTSAPNATFTSYKHGKNPLTLSTSTTTTTKGHKKGHHNNARSPTTIKIDLSIPITLETAFQTPSMTTKPTISTRPYTTPRYSISHGRIHQKYHHEFSFTIWGANFSPPSKPTDVPTTPREKILHEKELAGYIMPRDMFGALDACGQLRRFRYYDHEHGLDWPSPNDTAKQVHDREWLTRPLQLSEGEKQGSEQWFDWVAMGAMQIHLEHKKVWPPHWRFQDECVAEAMERLGGPLVKVVYNSYKKHSKLRGFLGLGDEWKDDVVQ